MSGWAKRTAQGWLLSIHAQPGAKRSAVAGIHGEALKLRLAAPPIEGRANQALVDFLADALGVPRKRVSVVRGASARHKTVLVASAQADPLLLLRL